MTQLMDGIHSTQTRLLVVDDDSKVLASLCPQLENNGFLVDAARDGRTAFQQARKQGYDLILLDMKMPGMNGLQVMSRLEKAAIDVPIVVVSGLSSFSTVRSALRRGAYDYLRKPYNLTELVNTVRSALRKHRLEQTRVAIQRCLNASEAFHRKAVNNMMDIVFALDRQGRFCFLNSRVESLLGYSSDELVGHPFHTLMEEQDVAAAVRLRGHTTRLGDAETREVRLKIRGNQVATRYFTVTTFPFESDAVPAADPGPTCFSAQTFGIARDITEHKEAEAFLRFQASHDRLTRLPNRVLFQDRLERTMAHARRNNQKFAVMFLDLNRFKQVNDTFGHVIGDRLLQRIAQRLKGCLRQEDTLSRHGGDEFTVLVPAVNAEEDARGIANKLIKSLQDPFQLDQHEVRVGASIGIAIFPDAGQSTDDLIQHADTAMYLAKSRGRDGYQFHR